MTGLASRLGAEVVIVMSSLSALGNGSATVSNPLSILFARCVVRGKHTPQCFACADAQTDVLFEIVLCVARIGQFRSQMRGNDRHVVAVAVVSRSWKNQSQTRSVMVSRVVYSLPKRFRDSGFKFAWHR
ncbi:hypothetical protein [Paraburkholderia nodosa]|uniref:hypothetical protein n=1 Tax=Paraburkholderia nodosa TaxID=392320 RepID=UPI0012B69371|nr:hypothetical protein [Paraburkholderia nodosa]